MKKIYRLITLASWEDRFYLGFEKTLKESKPAKVLMFYYAEYEQRTDANRKKVKAFCKKHGITVLEARIYFEFPDRTWLIIRELLGKEKIDAKKVLIDITTMPRDAIYAILSFLQYYGADVNYVYYRPKKYNSDWLSRDPGQPRLVFKHSGIARLGCKTVLVIMTGFDAERTDQLINYFEPDIAFLGFQKGKQFENYKQNIKRHKEFLVRWKAKTTVNIFSLDAYSKDHGYKILENKIKKYLDDSNIIVSSLGPKPSAVALYRLCKKKPTIAIAYVPSREFNLDYSQGLGRGVAGVIGN